MRKFIAFLVILLTMTAGTAETSTAKAPTYRQKVVKATETYGPCKAMRKTRAGRIMYRDLVSDNTDDGKRRTVKAQVRYVKQGCRNGA